MNGTPTLAEQYSTGIKKQQEMATKHLPLAGLVFSLVAGGVSALCFEVNAELKNVIVHEWIGKLIISLLGFAGTWAFFQYVQSAMIIFALRAHDNRDALGILNRIKEPLRAFLLHLNAGGFENKLSQFAVLDKESARRTLARVIEGELDRSFGFDEIQIRIDSQAEHSEILAGLLPVTGDVCTTCPCSPRRFFRELGSRRLKIPHAPLPSRFQTEDAYDVTKTNKTNAKEDDELSEDLADQYPVHFIRFLEKTNGNGKWRRRRLFLLGKDDWAECVDSKYIEYYRKFMSPCKSRAARIDTRFVRTETLKKAYPGNPNTTKKIKEALAKGNIDGDLFDQEAGLFYREEGEEGEVTKRWLQFEVSTERVQRMADFVNWVFSGEASTQQGVYQVDEFEADVLKFGNIESGN